MDRKSKARVASAILQVPLLIRGAIGLVGDAQVVRDFMSPGTQESEILAAFLGAPWAAWVIVSLAGVGLFAWSFGWWPFTSAHDKEPEPQASPPVISVVGNHATVSGNNIHFGPVTHHHAPPARAVPAAVASAFAGPEGRTVQVRTHLYSSAMEAKNFQDEMIAALRLAGVSAAAGGVHIAAPFSGVSVRPTENEAARAVAAHLVVLFRAAGIHAFVGELKSDAPFIRIDIGENDRS